MQDTIHVQIKRLDHAGDLALPSYESEHAAGMDVRAALHIDNPIAIEPRGGVALVPTGFAIAVPVGYEAQVRPRSGLAFKHAVGLPNSPGTIDADYRGELKIIMINHGHEPFIITRGMRIAQLIIKPVPRTVWETVDELSDTSRGEGGFGHTGV